MLRNKILFYDGIKENIKNAQRVLGSTGAECYYPESVEELRDLLIGDSFSLLIMELEAHRYLTEKGVKLEDENVIILSQEKLKRIHPYLKNLPTFSNFIAKNEEGTFIGRELLSTIRKMLNNDIFGVQKYLNWGASSMIFHVRDSSIRNDYVEIVANYCRRMKIREPIIQAAQVLSEEFLMNALYDAPRDQSGNEIYRTIPRSERIILEPMESVRIEIASDGEQLAISVSDPFGGITRGTVLEYLNRCFGEDKKFGPEEKSGAGLGLYLCFNSVSKFVVNVDPHIRTEFIGVIDLGLSVKEFKKQNKSFHFFTKDKRARQFDGPVNRVLAQGS